MNVVRLDDFRSHTSPLATIVRVGNFNQQFAHYQSQNLLPGKRAVIDAYNVKRQTDLLNELRAVGFERVLDRKAAELACPFKWTGQSRKAEWLDGEPERPLTFSDFNENMAVRIAERAVAHRFHIVLVPDRAAALKVKSPERLQKRLADYASSLDKTRQALEKIVSDSSMRPTGSIMLPHLGKSEKNDQAGGRR